MTDFGAAATRAYLDLRGEIAAAVVIAIFVGLCLVGMAEAVVARARGRR